MFGVSNFLLESQEVLTAALRLIWGKGGAAYMDRFYFRNNNKMIIITRSIFIAENHLKLGSL